MIKSEFLTRFSEPLRSIAAVISILIILLVILLGSLLGIGYWVNNVKVPFPSQIEVKESQLKAIGWIKVHESEVLATDNPALWWMLRDSAALSGNAYLAGLYARYYERYIANNSSNPWHHLFDRESEVWIPAYVFDQLPDYNQLFLYGLSCQPDLREEPQVKKLMELESCGKVGTLSYLKNPTCATHQLMGIHFMQQRRCEDSKQTDILMHALQDQIALEATWDFRGVVDYYLQKVLMLAESGATERIKPRWQKRVIDAQRPDGGWDNFYELIRLDRDHSIGWSAKGFIWIRRPESNFHTTTQGLYLMSLLSAHTSGAIDLSLRSRTAVKTD